MPQPRRIRAALKDEQPKNLLLFIGNKHENQSNGIAFSLTDYLELVDDTGRIIRNDKRGAISENSAKLLTKLNIAMTIGSSPLLSLAS